MNLFSNHQRPAFPVMPPLDADGKDAAGYPFPDAGMSRREYHASRILCAIVSTMNYPAFHGELRSRLADVHTAIDMADMLIQVLDRQQVVSSAARSVVGD